MGGVVRTSLAPSSLRGETVTFLHTSLNAARGIQMQNQGVAMATGAGADASWWDNIARVIPVVMAIVTPLFAGVAAWMKRESARRRMVFDKLDAMQKRSDERHVENLSTRAKEYQELIDRQERHHAENRTELTTIRREISDTRERVARIEGTRVR
jgi:hypothetical protein